MAFSRGPLRTPPSTPVRVAVFAVGARAYVAADGGGGPTRVMLTDDAGKKPLESLGDGDEVAILAWRPGWAGNTRYCVRAADSGLEGWLPVANLRVTEVAVSPAPAAIPPPPVPVRSSFSGSGDSGHRFGQRSR